MQTNKQAQQPEASSLLCWDPTITQLATLFNRTAQSTAAAAVAVTTAGHQGDQTVPWAGMMTAMGPAWHQQHLCAVRDQQLCLHGQSVSVDPCQTAKQGHTSKGHGWFWSVYQL